MRPGSTTRQVPGNRSTSLSCGLAENRQMSTPMASMLNRVRSPSPRNLSACDSCVVVELKAHHRNTLPCNWLYSSCRSPLIPRYTCTRTNGSLLRLLRSSFKYGKNDFRFSACEWSRRALLSRGCEGEG